MGSEGEDHDIRLGSGSGSAEGGEEMLDMVDGVGAFSMSFARERELSGSAAWMDRVVVLVCGFVSW